MGRERSEHLAWSNGAPRLTFPEALRLVVRCEAARQALLRAGYTQMEFDFLGAYEWASRELPKPLTDD